MIQSSLRSCITGSKRSIGGKSLLFILWVLLVAYVPQSAAQQAPPLLAMAQIDTIIIEGNRVTKPFVILAEIELQVGSLADSAALERDRKRLESLGLFSRAQLSLDTLPTQQTALRIQVTELWYIWPSLFLALDEQNPSRFGAGALISHDNFRGRRETLALSARFGYIEAQQFAWNIPYLRSDLRDYSMFLRLKSSREHEPRTLRERDDIDAIERSFDMGIGHRTSLENRYWAETSFAQARFESHDDRELNLTASGESYGDLNGSVGIGFTRDTRYYKPWATQGYLFSVHLGATLGLNNDKVRYLQPGLTLARYFSFAPRLHLAGRSTSDWIIGHSLRYRRLLLDSDNVIRTAMDRSYEGTWRSMATLELRGDLLPIRYVTLRSVINALRPYSKDLRFGLSGTLFVDGGVVGGIPYGESSSFVTEQTDGWDVSYGAGLVVHVPYRDIIRLEYARSARFPEDGYQLRIRIGPSF